MKIKDLEWQLQLLASAPVFDAQSKEALQLAGNVTATLRAGLDLPSDSDAAALATMVVRLTANRALEALHAALPVIEWALVQNKTMENAEILRNVARALDDGYGTDECPTEYTIRAEVLIKRLTDEMALCPPVGAAS